MIESFITVLALGFLSGFFLSIPVAGPISIVITSNALKGNRRFAIRTAIGASIIEFFYVFIAIFGIAMLYSAYKSFIPIILIAGSAFLIYVAYKIFHTKLELDNIGNKSTIRKIKDSGGMRTGLILNLTNPSLFLGWLTSSFIIFSFASTIGLNVGGLDLIVKDNVKVIEQMSDNKINDMPIVNKSVEPVTDEEQENKSNYKIFLSLIYAFAVSVGSFTWFFYFVKFIIHYRFKVSVKILNRLIQGLGVILAGIGVYLIYQGIIMLV